MAFGFNFGDLEKKERGSATMSGAQRVNHIDFTQPQPRRNERVTSFGDWEGAASDIRKKKRAQKIVRSVKDIDFERGQAKDRMSSARKEQKEWVSDLSNNESSRLIQERKFKEQRNDAAEAQRIALVKSSTGYKNLEKFHKGAFDVGAQAGRAAAIGMRQQVNFSEQQDNLRQMFGHGDKIWGTQMEPVRINNDLNASRSDPWDETAGMFGAGPHGQRSGLF